MGVTLTVFEICGVASGVISVVDAAPYIRDTIRGDTKPHRGTWLIWSVLAIVALASQAAQGGGWSVVMIATQVLFTTTIWLLSLRSGYGTLTTRERVMLVIAAVGVAAWVVVDDPAAATVAVVVADSIGVTMMLHKARRDPGSETVSTFALASIAGLLSAISLGRLDVGVLLYPIYFFVANGTIAAVLVTSRRTARMNVTGEPA